MLVDPHRAGLDPLRHLDRGVRIGGPYRRAQPHVQAVGHGDGLVQIRVLDDWQCRTELLLCHQRIVVGQVRDQRGRVEISGLLGLRIAADQHPATAVLGVLHEAGHDVVLLLVLQRAQHVLLLEPVAHGHLLGHRDQGVAHVVVDVLVDVEALERRAGLTGVDERTPEQVARDLLSVHVGQHDAGVVASQFQGQTSEPVSGGTHDGLAGLGGAGEHDLVDPGVLGQCLPDLATARDHVQHVLRKRLLEHVNEPQHG